MQRGTVKKRKLTVSTYLAVTNIIVILVAVIISMSKILGRPSPFSAAFVATLTGIHSVSAFVGSVAGFFLTGDYGNAVIICSSLLSVMAVRLMMKKENGRAESIIMAITCAASVFTANAVTSSGVSELMSCFALAVLSGGATPVFMHLKKLSKAKELTEVTIKNNPVGLLSVMTGGVIAISILSVYSFGVFSLGIIVSVALSCFVSLRYGSGAGAIAGSITAIGLFLGAGTYPHLAAVLSVAAAVTGLVKDGRKINAVSVFILTSVLCTVLFVMDNDNIGLCANIFMGCALFMAVPEKYLINGENIHRKSYRDNNIKELFGHRLLFAKNAINEVRRTIDMTAQKLEEDSKRDISFVYNSACDELCRKCRYNMQCWGNEYNDSIKQFSALLRRLRSNESIDETMFGPPISDRCTRKSELCEEMTRLYRSFVSELSGRRRISQMRGVLTAQLSATEKLLSSLAEETKEDGDIKSEYNRIAKGTLRGLGCDDTRAVNVTVGENGRMYLEAYSDKAFGTSKQDMAGAMTLAFHKSFDLPVVARVGDSYKLSMFTKTTYYLDVEIYQISKNENAPCGDYYDSFIDNKGNAYIVLSDGMGTGARARIDSAFVCDMLIKLLSAGTGEESAIEIVNASVMLKSSDESFATLELCKVDLYSGRVTIYKAGSADTYIKYGREYKHLSGSGLPVGVEDVPCYEKHSFTLSSKDMIIMTSDGAELNEAWLFREMTKTDIELKEFARNVAQTAKFHSGNKTNDDISVIAMRLCK
ncbi:MAG: SpoIIE family protein phosphatase [Ruminiclostridium sp.]|nr:SpoIIE family protein phosphatase [Ruminiclostridium sp.]